MSGESEDGGEEGAALSTRPKCFPNARFQDFKELLKDPGREGPCTWKGSKRPLRGKKARRTEDRHTHQTFRGSEPLEICFLLCTIPKTAAQDNQECQW